MGESMDWTNSRGRAGRRVAPSGPRGGRGRGHSRRHSPGPSFDTHQHKTRGRDNVRSRGRSDGGAGWADDCNTYPRHPRGRARPTQHPGRGDTKTRGKKASHGPDDLVKFSGSYGADDPKDFSELHERPHERGRSLLRITLGSTESNKARAHSEDVLGSPRLPTQDILHPWGGTGKRSPSAPARVNIPRCTATLLASGFADIALDADFLVRYWLTTINVQTKPLLTDEQLFKLFQQARKEVDLFGVKLTAKDIVSIASRDTLPALIARAKAEKRVQDLQGRVSKEPRNPFFPGLQHTFAQDPNPPSIFIQPSTPLPPDPIEIDQISPQDYDEMDSLFVSANEPLVRRTFASTPTVDRFLRELAVIVKARDGDRLKGFLVIEPPYQQSYIDMIREIAAAYPASSKESQDNLEIKCAEFLTDAQNSASGEDSGPWGALSPMIAQYLVLLRDLDLKDLIKAYYLLQELIQKCTTALGHSVMGIVILPTVIEYAKVLARLAIGLDKKLEMSLRGVDVLALPEKAADSIRGAFTICLADKGTSANGVLDGAPEGKKIGIYKLANLCLKILFQCGKYPQADQIFVNITQKSPPLSAYPKSERVAYLYYLGKFNYVMGHFPRAHLVLQEAYDLCHSTFLRQRRKILTLLVVSNIVIGRFPTDAIYSRPEALNFKPVFDPICKAIKKGDLATFLQLTDFLKGPHSAWLASIRAHQQIRSHGTVLAQRSLSRRIFLLAGDEGDGISKRAPTLELSAFLTAYIFCLRLAGTLNETYVDADFESVSDDEGLPSGPDLAEIECIVSALVNQGLIRGFMSHATGRLAVQGARGGRRAVEAGWPSVYEVVMTKAGRNRIIGWVREGEDDTSRLPFWAAAYIERTAT
ncbi:hypothetical protein EJ06DRAFT_342890 [Trichodelitschia bisporula]|uniref:PCI domain-containing protein n=1 Tax=Trichodelitschia bisporula TaxID=703511 RepID=A0A6G1I2V4_9PEZI|nr:hypothetical protein EJ06DRAFT_342890 [Trichodelitschia bisporula]